MNKHKIMESLLIIVTAVSCVVMLWLGLKALPYVFINKFSQLRIYLDLLTTNANSKLVISEKLPTTFFSPLKNIIHLIKTASLLLNTFIVVNVAHYL